ncbi:MAG: ComEA family DNA-binding protein [Patescibacteria group bacterium]|jgi:competence protein ComEA
MREYVAKNQFKIGFVLILLIFAGVVLIWNKDNQSLRSTEVSASQNKLDELESENIKLKAEIVELQKNTSISSASSQTNSEKININTADQSGLESLPAIGPVYATRMIEYREQNGGFKSIDEVKKVQGIGDKVYNTIKDLISI